MSHLVLRNYRYFKLSTLFQKYPHLHKKFILFNYMHIELNQNYPDLSKKHNVQKYDYFWKYPLFCKKCIQFSKISTFLLKWIISNFQIFIECICWEISIFCKKIITCKNILTIVNTTNIKSKPLSISVHHRKTKINTKLQIQKIFVASDDSNLSEKINLY